MKNQYTLIIGSLQIKKQIDANKTLTDYIISYTKLLNDLAKGIRLISVKRLTKNVIIGYSIFFNGATYLGEDGSQNYLVF